MFAAAVIGGVSLDGGRGTIFGAFTGILLLYLVQNVLTLGGVPAEWIGFLNGSIILGALVSAGWPRERRRSRRGVSSGRGGRSSGSRPTASVAQGPRQDGATLATNDLVASSPCRQLCAHRRPDTTTRGRSRRSWPTSRRLPEISTKARAGSSADYPPASSSIVPGSTTRRKSWFV